MTMILRRSISILAAALLALTLGAQTCDDGLPRRLPGAAGFIAENMRKYCLVTCLDDRELLY